MLDIDEYNDILQKISIMFLPDTTLIEEVKITDKKMSRTFKHSELLLAYSILCKNTDNKIDVNFKYKNDDIKYKSECYVNDLLYS